MNFDMRDDDALLAALGAALRTAEHPRSDLVVASAKDAFGYQHLDEELATLVYDSLLDTSAAGASRDMQDARVVVFENDTISVQVEIIGDTIVGQVVPAGVVVITVEVPDQDAVVVEADELGCFSLTASTLGALERGPLRFQIERNRKKTVTEWTHLPPSV